MIRWTGLAPWEVEFPFPGSLTSTFLSIQGLPDDADGLDVLKTFCETKDVENVLPYVRTRGGTRDEIMELRELLVSSKVEITFFFTLEPRVE